MAQVTINAKTGSTGVRSNVDTFSNARSASSGTTTNFVLQNTKTGGSYQIGRGFLNFTITSIPRGSKITAVTFVHPAVANFLNSDSLTTHIVDHTGNDPIVGADYDLITLDSDTSYGSVALSGLSTSTTTNISLDSNGVALLQTALDTGASIVKYAIRGSSDVNNSAPSGFNEYTIVSTDAQITVTYTPSGGAALFGGL